MICSDKEILRNPRLPTKDEGRCESEKERETERGREQESNAAIKRENQNNNNKKKKRAILLRGLQPQESRGAAKQNAVHECSAGRRLAQTQLSSWDRAGGAGALDRREGCRV